jgi:HemX protein
LLFAVFVFQTAFLWMRFVSLGHVPAYSPFDALLLASWLIVVVALVLNAFFRVDLLLCFVNVIGFAWVVFANFSRAGNLMDTARQSDLLLLHVALALVSYVAFAFSFVFSLMYLIQDGLLREKRWAPWYFRLPSLERLDGWAFRFVAAGFPLLLVAMVLGIIWGRLTLGRWLWWDIKSIVTFVLWCAYGVYLVVRLRSGWGGRRLAWLNSVCFGGVIVNFVVIGSLSLFHRMV